MIEIRTAEDLYNVRNNLSGEYIQMADIDLSEYPNWDPIGTSIQNFTGKYNGQFYKIINLTSTAYNAGLFGGVYEATIENVKIENANVKGIVSSVGNYGTVGVLAAVSNYCSFKNCSAVGQSEGNGPGTGILLGLSNESTIENCFARGTVTANKDAGGLIGSARNCNIINSYAACEIEGASDTEDTIGGLIGYSENNTIISCYYDATLSGRYDTDKGIPKTTEHMKTQNTFIGWDFEKIWALSPDINEGYPYHKILESEKLLYFLDIPEIRIQPPSANVVTVISPTAEYTASYPGISADEKVERIVEIEEGDQKVCRIVAEELLSRWSKEQKSVSGIVQFCQGLEFKQKVRVKSKEAMLDEDMTVQKLEHNILDQTTKVTAGDIILSDEELLARLLDKL